MLRDHRRCLVPEIFHLPQSNPSPLAVTAPPTPPPPPPLPAPTSTNPLPGSVHRPVRDVSPEGDHPLRGLSCPVSGRRVFKVCPCGRGGFSPSRSGSSRLGWKTRHTHATAVHPAARDRHHPSITTHFQGDKAQASPINRSTLSLQNWGAASEPSTARPAGGNPLRVSSGAVGTVGPTRQAVFRKRSFIFQIDSFKPHTGFLSC
uniref:Uncharacterized protein n=1 Tax=Rousettus aegyptiacus TaxID=9407 RepID=A0A7J8BRX7_ROUAE|nr:hypothetical protein HJG63_009628 [Rousettus aegyptiacus]